MSKVAYAPAETIRRKMNYLNFETEELATELGITTQEMVRVLTGATPIDSALAAELEKALGETQEFWLRLERNYRERIR